MMLVCAYSYIIGAINAAAVDKEVLDPVFGQWSVRARTDRLICSGNSSDAGSCADAQINHSGAVHRDHDDVRPAADLVDEKRGNENPQVTVPKRVAVATARRCLPGAAADCGRPGRGRWFFRIGRRHHP
jgi:hypothetical protein